jgi:hypothetical protein
MGWDAIYWHVWAACIILRVKDFTISALEVDRYSVEPDGLVIVRNVNKENNANNGSTLPGFESSSSFPLSSDFFSEFSLSNEDDNNGSSSSSQQQTFKIFVNKNDDFLSSGRDTTTPTLNPNRPPEVLTSEIFDLICLQMKFVVGIAHKQLIQNTMQSMINSSKGTEHFDKLDETYEALWNNGNGPLGYGDDEDGIGIGGGMISERRRGRSPGRPARASSLESNRKQSRSLSKLRQSSPQHTNPQQLAASSALDSSNHDSDAGGPSDSDVINDGIASLGNKKGGASSIFTERRSRSTSTGKRVTSLNSLVKGGAVSNLNNSASRERLRSRGGVGIVPGGNDVKGSGGDLSTVPSRSQLETVSSSSGKENETLLKQFETLKSLPPDLYHRIAQHRLPIHGVFMTPLPLQTQPLLLEEMLMVVTETTTLTDHKKLEWELDLMREYDEKKMDRLERYLISKRNPLSNQSLIGNQRATGSFKPSSNKNFKSSLTNNEKSNYYKDRARQPINCIN